MWAETPKFFLDLLVNLLLQTEGSIIQLFIIQMYLKKVPFSKGNRTNLIGVLWCTKEYFTNIMAASFMERAKWEARWNQWSSAGCWEIPLNTPGDEASISWSWTYSDSVQFLTHFNTVCSTTNISFVIYVLFKIRLFSTTEVNFQEPKGWRNHIEHRQNPPNLVHHLVDARNTQKIWLIWQRTGIMVGE